MAFRRFARNHVYYPTRHDNCRSHNGLIQQLQQQQQRNPYKKGKLFNCRNFVENKIMKIYGRDAFVHKFVFFLSQTQTNTGVSRPSQDMSYGHPLVVI
jgi:hypothetical protein